MKTVGVISDTHGKLMESAIAALSGNYTPDQVAHHVTVDAKADSLTEELSPCDLIVHAGDVGNATAPAQWILARLKEIAPLVAVHGNCDYPENYTLDGKPLPSYAVFEEYGLRFAVLHEPQDLRAAVKGGLTNPAYITPEPRVQIHGHTHIQRVNVSPHGIVTICPGSISRPKEGNPPTVAVLKVEEPGKLLSVDIIEV